MRPSHHVTFKRLDTSRVRRAGLALLLLLAGGELRAQLEPVRLTTVASTMDELESAYRDRNLARVLALYSFPNEEGRQRETEALQSLFAAEEVLLSLQRPAQVAAEVSRIRVAGQIFSTTEPRARVDECRFTLERDRGGWAVTSRQGLGEVDGLVHLSLDPRGFKADGLSLKLEDFEMRFRRGTLFTSPDSLGPTLLIFVGEGEVVFSPSPAAEREELRRFAGAAPWREEVRNAFVRIHPADLHRVLGQAPLPPDPDAPARLPAAQRVYRAQAQRYFILDAALPKAPWWLLPSVGDASVTFATRRHGELTYAVSSSEAEDLSLFDRARRRQICLYPSGGREARYSEDASRGFDLLHLDLRARFEPARRFLSGEATLRLKLLQPLTTLRLRLDDDFRVESVTSAEGGRHLFFRVRGQGGLMISLGALAGARGDVTLTVRYSGVHEPAPVEQEVAQVKNTVEVTPFDEGLLLEGVLVYANRTAWYPRPALDDHATATLRFDVPVGLSVVTGGERTSARVVGDRTIVEYRLNQPGKYITAAVGRFFEAGEREVTGLRLRAFGMTRTKDEAASQLERASAILAFFNERFGPCPYPDLNLLFVEGPTPGGHAPPGMVLLQRRPPLLRRTLRDDPASFPDEPDFFLAHELAHQWWGQAVSGANYHERWLSEGVAQYAAALWVRESRGEGAFKGVLERFSRWALRYEGEAPIQLGYRVGHLEGDAQAFRAVVYDKAAYVLHMLSGLVGEDAFGRGLRAYQEAHRFSKAGTDDLREALESVSGKDLGPYFREWIFGTATARLSYKTQVESAGAGYRVVLVVRASGLPGPVPVEVRLKGGASVASHVVQVAPGETLVSLEAAFRPGTVELNGNRGLLARVDGS